MENRLILTNRTNLSLNGVKKVKSATETIIDLILEESTLSITGSNLHILKLDVNNGLVEIEGMVDAVKFNKAGNKENLLKKVFK